MSNQFLRKRWTLEKLLAKREGADHNSRNGPLVSQTLSKMMLDDIDMAIAVRKSRGETWARYWSQNLGDWIVNKEADDGKTA